MATKIKFSGHTVPDAPGTPAGLPDLDTLKAIRENCELLWMACREITIRAGIPRTTMNGQDGYHVSMNVTSVIQDMWDGFDPLRDEGRRIRQIMYRYLKLSGNMFNTSRGKHQGRWWISETWNAAPRNVAMVPGVTIDELPATPTLKEDLVIRYQCVYPGCLYPRSMAAPQMGMHVKTHGLTLAEYMKAAAGEQEWPEADFTGLEEALTEALSEPDTTTAPATYSDDPVAAVMALVNENNRLRSLTSDSGLAEENLRLRAELSEALDKLAVMRRKQEAVDRMMGRR